MAILFPAVHGYRVNINGLDLSQGWSDAKLRDVMYQLTASPADEALILESCSGLEADRIMNPGTTMILEAVTSKFEKLERTTQQLGRIIKGELEKATGGTDNPLTADAENVTLGPIRKNNLFAYRTATFDISDGQTVSILFHSPDSDPLVMEAGETLIAYRWMVNKTDVTIAVAPEGGKDITGFQMATRLSKIIIANSPKFTANAANRAETTAQLQEAESKRTELRDRANSVAAEIQDFSDKVYSLSERVKKIDENIASARAVNERLKAAKAQPAPAPTPSQTPATSGRRGGFGPRNKVKFEGTPELQAQFINDFKALGWQDLGDGGIGFVRNGRVVIKGYPDPVDLSALNVTYLDGSGANGSLNSGISYDSENTATYASSYNKQLSSNVDTLESSLKNHIQNLSEMKQDESNTNYRIKKAEIEKIEAKIGKSDYVPVAKKVPPNVTASATYDSGNDTLTTTVRNPQHEQKGSLEFIKYEVETKGDSRKGIVSFKEVVSGSPRAFVGETIIKVGDKQYIYTKGAHTPGNERQRNINNAAIQLATELQKKQAEAKAMPAPAPVEPVPVATVAPTPEPVLSVDDLSPEDKAAFLDMLDKRSAALYKLPKQEEAARKAKQESDTGVFYDYASRNKADAKVRAKQSAVGSAKFEIDRLSAELAKMVKGADSLDFTYSPDDELPAEQATPMPEPVEPTAPAADLTGTRFESVQLPARGSKETDIKNIEFDFTKIAKMIKQDCQTLLGSAAYGSAISVTQQKPYISIKVTALPDGVTAQSKDANAMLAALQAIGEAYMVEKDGAQNIRAINVALDSRLTTSAPTPAQKLYRYAMVNRPVFIGTTPKDGLVGTEPRPNAGDAHYATARNGIAVFNRKLTDAETKQFEMSPMVGGEDMREYANMVAKKMGEYASAYLDMEEEDHKSFLDTVDSFIKNNDAGYYPSLENKSEFVDMVKGMLIDIASAPETYPAPTPEPEPEPAAGGVNNERNSFIKYLNDVINGIIQPDSVDLDILISGYEKLASSGDSELENLFNQAVQIAQDTELKSSEGI